MQALHRKLDVLVQILPYNCSETNYSFCEDSPPSRTPPSTQMWVSPSDPFSSPPTFFRSSAPDYYSMYTPHNPHCYHLQFHVLTEIYINTFFTAVLVS